jgi:DNA invertase Pin-like site-specific DNA recombinase
LAGEAGAVFSIEASRLARNGRDWHHLIELCGMAGTLVVDTEGVYDPRLWNDRLLLGLKGTMSEFELGLLRQRSHEAARQKARRSELRFLAPIGYCWPREGKLEMDFYQRVQQALRLAFAKLTELGSVRQVLLWFRAERIELPGRAGRETIWRLPVYESVLHSSLRSISPTRSIDALRPKSAAAGEPFLDTTGNPRHPYRDSSRPAGSTALPTQPSRSVSEYQTTPTRRT